MGVSSLGLWLCGPDLLQVFFSPLLLHSLYILFLYFIFSLYHSLFIALSTTAHHQVRVSPATTTSPTPCQSPLPAPPEPRITPLSLSLPPSFIYLAKYTDIPSSRPP